MINKASDYLGLLNPMFREELNPTDQLPGLEEFVEIVQRRDLHWIHCNSQDRQWAQIRSLTYHLHLRTSLHTVLSLANFLPTPTFRVLSTATYQLILDQFCRLTKSWRPLSYQVSERGRENAVKTIQNRTRLYLGHEFGTQWARCSIPKEWTS